MPDKDFEQQIREGLGDWEMVPPPPVRQAVLDSVRQRRRRRAILWIPSALLLLGLLAGGAWYILRVGPEGAAPSAGADHAAGAEATTAAGAATPVAPSTGVGHAAGAGDAAVAPSSGLGTPAGAGAATPATPSAGAGHAAGTTSAAGQPAARSAGAATPGVTAAEGRSARTTTSSAAAAVRRSGRGTRATTETRAGTALSTSTSPATPAESPYGPAQHDLRAGAGTGTVPLPGEWWTSVVTAFPLQPAAWPAEASPARTDNADKKAPGKKTTGRPAGSDWSFRISASAGVSGQGSFLQFSAPAKTIYTRFYQFPSSALNAANPTPGGGGAATSGYDTLAGRKTGAGWTLGVAIQHRLSAHIRVGAGVDYARFDTRIGPVSGGGTAPGAQTSAYLPNSSYNSGSVFTYVNRYTLLRVPLDLTWMIAPTRRWNPSVYGGMSGAFLFSGDALMYEPNVSGYTKSSLLYRHWSLYGELGFSVDLVHAGWFVLQAGPVVQYGFTGLEKPAPVKDHLNYAGIRLDMVLPVKTNKQKP